MGQFPERTRIFRPTDVNDLVVLQEWRQVRESPEQLEGMEAVLTHLKSACQGLGFSQDWFSSISGFLACVPQIKGTLYRLTDQSELRDRVFALIAGLFLIKSFGVFAASEVLASAGVILEG